MIKFSIYKTFDNILNIEKLICLIIILDYQSFDSKDGNIIFIWLNLIYFWNEIILSN